MFNIVRISRSQQILNFQARFLIITPVLNAIREAQNTKWLFKRNIKGSHLHHAHSVTIYLVNVKSIKIKRKTTILINNLILMA